METELLPLELKLFCPKVGLVLDVGFDWSAKLATAPDVDFSHVCLRLEQLELHLPPAGTPSSPPPCN